MSIVLKIKRKLKPFYTTVCKAREGKENRVALAADLLYCRMRFHVTYDEYLQYHYYHLKNRYRKHFILYHHQKEYFPKLVSQKGFTRSKYTFYQRVPDLYGREMICAPQCGEEVFVAFVRKHRDVFVKPDCGSLGQGVQRFRYTDDAKAAEFFCGLGEGDYVCEERICQHEVLETLNPFSVNTVRIVTLLCGDEVHIISAALRMGARRESLTDNLNAGGIAAQIDVQSGLVSTFGYNSAWKRFTQHPLTAQPILGLSVPHWEALTDLVRKAHKRLPQCLLYGWDIAITQNGPVIVEANNRPTTELMQMDCIPKGQILLPILKKHK